MTEDEKVPAWRKAQQVRDGLVLDVERARRLSALGDRGEAAAEALTEELCSVLEVRARVVVEVLISTGGPETGVEFEVEQDGRGRWELLNARAWFRDGFEPRAYCPIDDGDADDLAELWGVLDSVEGVAR